VPSKSASAAPSATSRRRDARGRDDDGARALERATRRADVEDASLESRVAATRANERANERD